MRLIVVAAPPVSSDIYRYIWDGRVQAAGINPYRYVPADEALRTLRDEAIYPSINRADYAPTIYPPAAQIVFFAVTRISESPVVMKAAMLLFEALAVWAMLALLSAQRNSAGRDSYLCLASVAAVGICRQRPCRHRRDRVSVARIRCGRPPYAECLAGLRSPQALSSNFFRCWRRQRSIRGGIGACRSRSLSVSRCFICLISAPDSQVFGFLGGYVSEEGFANGSGIFLWSLLTAIVPLPADVAAFYLPFAALVLIAIAVALFLRQRPPAAICWPRQFSFSSRLFCCRRTTRGISLGWCRSCASIRLPAGLYLTCAATYLHLAHWPPTLLEGALIYGGALVALPIEFIYRWYTKGELRGNTITA